jgi:hypothetical protein
MLAKSINISYFDTEDVFLRKIELSIFGVNLLNFG